MAKQPVARKHRGYIRVRWQGQEKQFGRWDDSAAWRRFEAWREEVAGRAEDDGAGPPTMAQLTARYLAYCRTYYRHPDGSQTPEFKEMRRAIGELLGVVGVHVDPVCFDVRTLRQVRDQLVARKLARPVINQRINRICRFFRWAGEEELIPAEIWHRLKVMTPLKQGRSPAPEPPDILPVPDDVFRATLPLLSPVVRSIALFQRLTGCRPDEACRVRARDIDRRGDVWVYSPTCPATGKPRHKLAWRGKPRAILIGPQLQRLLAPLVAEREPDDYLFRPKDQPRARKRLQPCYRPASYYRAIRRSIEDENGRRQKLAEEERRRGVVVVPVLLPQWCPLQLRHTALTEFKDRFGWRTAQELAGHAIEQTTRGYVEERMLLALEAAKKAG